jgi:hypothetical protein
MSIALFSSRLGGSLGEAIFILAMTLFIRLVTKSTLLLLLLLFTEGLGVRSL